MHIFISIIWTKCISPYFWHFLKKDRLDFSDKSSQWQLKMIVFMYLKKNQWIQRGYCKCIAYKILIENFTQIHRQVCDVGETFWSCNKNGLIPSVLDLIWIVFGIHPILPHGDHSCHMYVNWAQCLLTGSRR